MVKIHILGGPGSGKTTLAQDISSRFHIPHYELDRTPAGWEGKDQIVTNIDYALTLAQQPGWVTENIGLIWIDPLLDVADCIVLLEVSWPVAAWRILRRHILNSLRGTQRYPGINGVKALFMLLKGARQYHLNKANPETLASMRMYFEEHRDRVEPIDTAYLLMQFETYPFALPPTADFVRKYLEKYQEKIFIVRNKTDRERLFQILTKR